MPTLELILSRAEALRLPMAQNQFEKTNKKPIPEPPYIVWLVEESDRGDDIYNRIREIDGSLELYTDRNPDPVLEKRMEEEVLFDIPYRKYQVKINSENMVQTAYEFSTIQKKGNIKNG